jgi:hypothetical protein
MVKERRKVKQMKLRSAPVDDIHQAALIEFERSRLMTVVVNGLYGLHSLNLLTLIKWRR